MPLSASLRSSVTELTRRRARTIFSVLTLAIAVASISFLAIPALIDRAMQDEVRAGALADVTLHLRSVELSDADLAGLEALPDVRGLEARSSVDVRVLVGERRAPARVIGVRDFADQDVDVVRLEAGALPQAAPMSSLTCRTPTPACTTGSTATSSKCWTTRARPRSSS